MLGLRVLKGAQWRGGCGTLAARRGGANNNSSFIAWRALVLIFSRRTLSVVGCFSFLLAGVRADGGRCGSASWSR
jgi:hypothetical protein